MPRFKAVYVTHIGSYATLSPAHAAIDQYTRHTLKITAPSGRVFIKGPGMLFKGKLNLYHGNTIPDTGGSMNTIQVEQVGQAV